MGRQAVLDHFPKGTYEQWIMYMIFFGGWRCPPTRTTNVKLQIALGGRLPELGLEAEVINK